MTRPQLLPALFLALALVVGACSSDDGDGSSDGDGESSATTEASEPTLTEVPAGAAVEEVSDDLSSPPELTVEGTDEAPADLVVEDVVEGDGTEAEPGDQVEVNYTGVLTDGTEFDSSWSRGETITFGLDQVIPGWSEGLVGMQEGGRRLLIVPPEMAYGSAPPPGSAIPPDATLVFVVDLVSVGGA